MRVPRTHAGYDGAFVRRCHATLRQVATRPRQTLQYAGKGEWSVFTRPVRASEAGDAARVPGTEANEPVTILDPELWNAFRDVSL